MADTQEMVDEEQSEEGLSAPSLPDRFRINFDSYADRGRSVSFFLSDRMCAESRARLGEETQTRVPVEDPATKSVQFVTRTVRYGDDAVAVIRECCSRKPGYRNPRLPVKEILFRIMLAEGNRVMTVDELRSAASEWVGYEYGGDLSAEALRRVMAGDDYYGFEPVP